MKGLHLKTLNKGTVVPIEVGSFYDMYEVIY